MGYLAVGLSPGMLFQVGVQWYTRASSFAHVVGFCRGLVSDYCSDVPVRPLDVVRSIRNRPTIITIV